MIGWMSNKRIRDLDFVILLIVAVVAVISVIMVASASRINLTGNPSYFFIRQIVWFGIGFGGLLSVIRYDYKEYVNSWKWLYGFGVGTLLLVSLIGSITNGAQSWLQIGPIKYEPAEMMKLFLIAALANKLHELQELQENYGGIPIRKFMIVLLIALAPIGLVILQPDLGTAMMMTAIVAGMVWAAGIERLYLWTLVIGIVLGIGGLTLLYWTRQDWFFSFIQPYQWDRLTTFLHPEETKTGSGYQLYQSLLAIGAGQVWGEGIFRGIQTQGAWIPERHTDFIFAVLAEETGFLGAGFLLISYFLLLDRMLKIGREARDRIGSLLVAGVVSMFLAQIFENIGMAMALMPITGITLPLMSYGGSSILSSTLAIGLVLNVGFRRKPIKF